MIYFRRLKGLSSVDAKSKINHCWTSWEISKLETKKKIEDLRKEWLKKVQFISTVIHNPPLLILDEPLLRI